jgi:hypothetical protein
MRVLIVEDEPYLAEAVRGGLRLEAIAADIAGDGSSALELRSGIPILMRRPGTPTPTPSPTPSASPSPPCPSDSANHG